jgi:hypothetical protein
MAWFNDKFDAFIDQLTRFGLEYWRRYYGPYKAKVISNNDPSGTGRVLVNCPRSRLGEGNSKWVLPMMSGAGPQCGMFWPPEKDDYVFVFFDNGDPERPCGYLGGWYAEGEIHPDLDTESDGSPKQRGFRTPGGHLISLSDKGGEERVLIRHKDGTIVEWTSGGKVQIGKEGGSFEPLLKGTAVKQYIDSHTHPHSWGPTGPPISPLPPTALSDDSETS